MLETRSPVSRVLSRAAIPLGRLSPGASLPATKALLAVASPAPPVPTGTGSSLLPWLASRRAGITCWGVSAKPGVSSLHDIRRLVRAARRSGLFWWTGWTATIPTFSPRKFEPHRARVNYPHAADRLRSCQFIWEQNGKVQASRAPCPVCQGHSPQTGPEPERSRGSAWRRGQTGWNLSARLLVPSPKNGTAERA